MKKKPSEMVHFVYFAHNVAQEQRTNEVFIDVIERLLVSIAADVSYSSAEDLSFT